ncbi:MAG: pyridoxamine 5'-phosphate oxidase family protein [Acidobacteria bacterium]|nr:MAG: pyridoxamine 5'-phosphate oxidase family protein [Acidobacteriota bacterium]
MGKVFEQIDDKLREFIAGQRMFFVASAPLTGDGHVNLSPKGLDAFRVLGPTTVAYLDLAGSGVETIAHLRENGRITLLFCAFEGPPKILRLYGEGRPVFPGDDGWDDLISLFPTLPGTRSVIVVECTRIADSCGFGIPLYDFRGDRTQLTAYADRKGEEGILDYMRTRNRTSLDGLDGLAGIAAYEEPS